MTSRCEHFLKGECKGLTGNLIERGCPLAELVKSYSDITFNTVFEVATNNSSDAAWIAAANCILDRGYSKPKNNGAEAVELFAIII